MDIPGYTYIQHKVKQRPWGPEVQFTAARADGSHINDVIGLSTATPTEQELTALIQARCELIDAPPPAPPTETVEITNQDGTVTTMEVPL